MKILIVDDEQLARERLHDLLQDATQDIELRLAEDGLACLDIARNEHIDIVLLDIRMPGMDGLETAYHLARLELGICSARRSPPIWFRIRISAWGRWSITAVSATTWTAARSTK